jgi:hypothetical protein
MEIPRRIVRISIGLRKTSVRILWTGQPLPSGRGDRHLMSQRCRSIGHSRKFVPTDQKRKEEVAKMLIGTNSLKEGAMWHVHGIPE